MRKLRYLAQARDDLISIKRYIAKSSGSVETAIQYTDKLRQQCIKLAGLPGQLGRLRPELQENIRSFPFDNYIIFFMYENECTIIVTIIEGHRDIDSLFQ